jgi:hypothetical protein
MVAVAIVTLFVAATLALPNRPGPLAAASAAPDGLHQSSAIAPAGQPVALPSAPTVERAAAAPVVTPRAVSKSPQKTGLTEAEKNQIAESTTPAAAVAAISEALAKVDSTTTPASFETISTEPTVESTTIAGPGTVTITGCLEGGGSENRFRLTDTEGGDVPRSRSWRTGFLKKHSTSVALVEPSNPHALQAQVGQRVAATGLMTSRELRVTSLQVIGPRCN